FIPSVGGRGRCLDRQERSIPRPHCRRPIPHGYAVAGARGLEPATPRHDRPVRGSRRLTTIGVESLYSCGFAAFWPPACAWLSQAEFRRLLPVCCPDSTVVGCACPVN